MKIKFVFISFLLLFTSNLWSQTSQQLKLEKEKEKLLKEINDTKELLNSTSEIEKKELSYLDKQIKNITNQKKILYITQYETTELAITELQKKPITDACILLKASQGMHFDTLFNSIDW